MFVAKVSIFDVCCKGLRLWCLLQRSPSFSIFDVCESPGYATETLLVQKQPPEVFYKKGVCSSKFCKYLCQSHFFNKVRGLRSAALLKRVSGTGVFLWNMRKFSEHLSYRTPPDHSHSWLHKSTSTVLLTQKHVRKLFLYWNWNIISCSAQHIWDPDKTSIIKLFCENNSF